MCNRVQVKADGGLKAFLFNWGFSRKLYHLEEGRSYKNVRRLARNRHCHRSVLQSAVDPWAASHGQFAKA